MLPSLLPVEETSHQQLYSVKQSIKLTENRNADSILGAVVVDQDSLGIALDPATSWKKEGWNQPIGTLYTSTRAPQDDH